MSGQEAIDGHIEPVQIGVDLARGDDETWRAIRYSDGSIKFLPGATAEIVQFPIKEREND